MLHSFVKEMELFYEEEIIKLEDIFEIVIKRLLKLQEVSKAIPKIRTLLKLRGNTENYAVVFCYLILNIIIRDIQTASHKRNLAKIAFYTYSRPLELLDIIEARLKATLSKGEDDVFFERELKRVKSFKCYNPDN
jgi:hypothetical protein